MLLLDEPMAGMGKEEGAKMVEILNRLRGEITILLVEHDMDAVFSLADRLSVLVNGHIIATDTVENIRGNDDVQKAYLGDAHA
jgi:branched-chain amino acid transport system ATP-binding protein